MANLKLTDEDGNIIETTRTKKSGGEGDVYDILGNPDIVVKIYNDGKRSNQKKFQTLINKVQVMCQINDEEITKRAGWPQKIVYLNDEPVGFIMNKIRYANTFHQLKDAVDRKAKFLDNNWKFLLLVAYNLACAVNVLHEKGVIIGDINESNFLIGNRTIAEKENIFDFKNNGIVYSIDCDSFQILTEEENFLCTVGKQEYTPPELIGANLHKIIRTKNHDNFGLAVMIFHLLMLGIHPFIGINTPGEVLKSIDTGNFIFGKNAKANQILPPFPSDMYFEIYNSLNEKIRNLFEKAFDFGPNAIRPDAKEWIEALYEQIEDLIQCKDKQEHYYNKASNECIWCKIETNIGIKPWEFKKQQMAYNSPINSFNTASTASQNAQANTNNNIVQNYTNLNLNNYGSNSSYDFMAIFKFATELLAKMFDFYFTILKWIFSKIHKFFFAKNGNGFWIILISMLSIPILNFMNFEDKEAQTGLVGLLDLLFIIIIILWGIIKRKFLPACFLFLAMIFLNYFLYPQDSPQTKNGAQTIPKATSYKTSIQKNC